ncbi:MAG: hypothetical protein J5649_11240 [Lachnospiraceae bacterium]|nr:hypothetical protein [Lachnospiraceae bacterium]
MEEVKEEKQKKPRRGIEDRHLAIVNIIMFVFLLNILFFTMLETWPPDRETAVTVENKTGEPCYIAILSTDTERYGATVEKNLFGDRYADCFEKGEETDLYWQAVEGAGIVRGLSEEEAKSLASAKKQELAMPGNRYAFEMYRELVQEYYNCSQGYLNKRELNPEDYAPYKDWVGIAAYEDPEGYRFVHQNVRQVQQGETVARWYDVLVEGPFKVLLYWPFSERYAVSGTLESKQCLDELRVSVTELPESVGQISVENVSRSEMVPLWIILLAFVVSVGVILLIAFSLGATKRQLKIITLVSAGAQVILYAFMILTHNALMVEGSLRVHYGVFVPVKAVFIPLMELPLYAHFLREKESRAPWFRYCEFTLFVNWAPIVLSVAGIMLVSWLF